MTSKAYVALGANMGDRAANLKLAMEYISKLAGTGIGGASKIYETDPVGYAAQEKFLNMVIEVSTSLEPLDFLKELLSIEELLKRKRDIRWGPRTIDIDILLYEDREIDLPELTVPHPRMFERAFVLIPLKDVYPHDKIKGRDMGELIEECADKDGVRLYREESL